MSVRYLIHEFRDCCDSGINYLVSWNYVPANGGQVYNVENTYYQGNWGRFAWIEADEDEVTADGALRGRLTFSVRCLNACTIGLPLELYQIGGFAMPESVSTYQALYASSNVISPGGTAVRGYDVPYGATVKIQCFGGVGEVRYWSANNTNILIDGSRISNYRTVESADCTTEIYAPHLYNSVPGQLAAGVPYIFQRRFDQGSHIVTIQADKIGPSYLQVMDMAGCIRYWVINVVTSHCYDWVGGAARNDPDTTNSVKTLGDFSSATDRQNIYLNEFRCYPMDDDGPIVHQYYDQSAQDQDPAVAWCECDTFQDETRLEKLDTTSSNPNGAELYAANTVFTNGSRLYGEGAFADMDKDFKMPFVFPRTLNGHAGGEDGNGYLFCGEKIKPKLPESLVRGAFSNKLIGAGDWVSKMPLVDGDDDEPAHYHGATSKNTGPQDWIQNNDQEFVKCITNGKRDYAEVWTRAPTNFLSSQIQFETRKIDGESYYNNQMWDRFYKTLAPPIAKSPNEVLATTTEPAQVVAQMAEIPQISDNASYIGYLEYSPMGDRISWTQNLVVANVRSFCPSFTSHIQTRDINKGNVADFLEDDKQAWIVPTPNTYIRIGVNWNPVAKRLAEENDDVFTVNKLHIMWPGPFYKAIDQDSYKYPPGPLSEAREGSFYLMDDVNAVDFDMQKDYLLNLDVDDPVNSWHNGMLQFWLGQRYGAVNVADVNPYEDTRLGPDAQGVQTPYPEDDWFHVDRGGIFYDFDHIPNVQGGGLGQESWDGRLKDRDFYDDSDWYGIHEQLRGARCMGCNVENLKLVNPVLMLLGKVDNADEAVATHFDLGGDVKLIVTTPDGLGQGNHDLDKGFRDELA